MIGAGGLIIAALFYRRTYPGLDAARRALLTGLRGLWMSGIVVLLLSPMLRMRFERERPQKVAVYLDHSASMGLRDNLESRPDSLNRAVEYLRAYLDKKNVDDTYFRFSHVIQPDTLPDTLFNGLTGFSRVARHAAERAFDKIFVLTDGRQTMDEPRPASVIPVYTVALGRRRALPDLAIARVEFKPEVIRLDTARVTVTLRGHAYQSGRVRVRLLENGRVMRQKIVTMPDGDANLAVTFHYVPQKKGYRAFTVTADGDVKENNRRNNRYRYRQWVRKSRLQIGLLAARPGYDLKFIRQALQHSRDLRPVLYVPVIKGVSAPAADSLEVLFVIGEPAPSQRTFLQRYIKRGTGLVWFLEDSRDQSSWFRESAVRRRLFGQKREGLIHPTEPLSTLMDIFGDPQKSRLFWENVPPLEIYNHLSGGGLHARIGQSSNAFLISLNRPFRALVNGVGLWRAAFQLREDGLMYDGYNRFIQMLAYRAARRNQQKNVRLSSDRRVYKLGETIRLTAYVQDERQQPVPGARVTVEARTDDQRYQFSLEERQPGIYEIVTPAEATGAWRISATARKNDTALGQDALSLQVQENDAEFTNLRADTLFLKEWARQSGGAFLTLTDLKKKRNVPPLQPLMEKRTVEHDLKNSRLYLLILLLLLTLEWALRKKFKLI